VRRGLIRSGGAGTVPASPTVGILLNAAAAIGFLRACDFDWFEKPVAVARDTSV
jgi:hypothetical protein